MFKSPAFFFLFVLTVANCQFFYNYEEDKPQTFSQNSGSEYNPPTAVSDQFIQPRSNIEPDNNSGHRRTRIRVRSRGSPPASTEPQLASAAEPEADDTAARQARRRDRQNSFTAPVTPAIVYSPSFFENIGFGEEPSGVYVPPDSLLIVLRNLSRRAQSSYPVSQPQAASLPTTNYVQPSVNYVNSEPQQRFFVQPPPTNNEPRQPNFIFPFPVTKPENQHPASAIHQTINVNFDKATKPCAVETSRQATPVADIDSFRPVVDDFDRENVMSGVKSVPVTVQRNTRHTRPQKRQRTVTSYQLTTAAPRVYSPSLFDKIPLGEAPDGIYVPEDSLLNVLRNPSSGQYSTPRISRQQVPQVPPQIQSYAAPDDYEDEIIEEQYQPPPPPPPPAPRRPSQRTRQVRSTRRDQPSVQVVQQSSEHRNQRRNDEFEDYERQRLAVQHRTQSNRRQSATSATTTAAVPATKSRPQASTADRGESTFKKANLEIAELPHDSDEDGIPGKAGTDYPTFHVIPKTSFSCAQQAHNGYYADLETSCQVVHMCQAGGVKSSFLCPNGTIFNQEKFSCQWWYKVVCNDAPNFYIKNDELYKVPEKKERRRN